MLVVIVVLIMVVVMVMAVERGQEIERDTHRKREGEIGGRDRRR